MLRRKFLNLAAAPAALLAGLFSPAKAQESKPATRPDAKNPAAPPKIEKLELSPEEWAKRLTKAQFYVLRQEGTERAGSSPLDREKRKGTFVCAGCGLPVFTSAMKYDSGTGWPSFFATLPGVFEFKTDWKLVYPRTEYHCARCGGHHGHVFNDGPAPTGKRYCNNGLALKFVPDEAAKG